MKNFWIWFFGTFIGSLIAGIIVFFMSPVDAEDFRANLRQQYQDALAAGREASASKQAELEADLTAMSADQPNEST